MQIKKICVFCGSSAGMREDYAIAAEGLGELLVRKGIELVYGAGNAGLMGILARSVLAGGGRVTGVIPKKIDAMVSGLELSEKIVTSTMHERKNKMYELSDAFIALPGGIGTMEELFEVFTWRQLGYHNKPVGVLNICGFFNELHLLLERLQTDGFLNKAHAAMLCSEDDPEKLLEMLHVQSREYIGKFDRIP